MCFMFMELIWYWIAMYLVRTNDFYIRLSQIIGCDVIRKEKGCKIWKLVVQDGTSWWAFFFMNWCLTISDYNPFCILFSQSTLWVYYNIVVFQFLNLLMTIYYIIHTDVFLLFLFRMLMGKRPFADIFYWILNSCISYLPEPPLQVWWPYRCH